MSIFTSHTETIRAALDWLSRGAVVIPCQPDSKNIIAGYGKDNAICTEQAARLWFEERRANMAVVLGVAGLVCLDFDNADLYSAWRRGPGKEVQTVIEVTRRGVHVFFTAPGKKPRIYKPARGLEVKLGGAAIGAPSVVAGVMYRRLTDFPLQTLRPEFLGKFAAFSSVSEKPVKRAAQSSGRAGDVLQRIKQTFALADVIGGKVRLTGDGNRLYGTCPFHDDQARHLWVDLKSNTWGCYSADCAQYGAHDIINWYAEINCLSVKEAISRLAAQLPKGA